MQTQCPSCKSLFRVTHQQLSVAGGMVRCGRCSSVFNGNENIKRLRSARRVSPAPAPHRMPDGTTQPKPPAVALPAAVSVWPPAARKPKPHRELKSASPLPAPASEAAQPQSEQAAHQSVQCYFEPTLETPPRSRGLRRWGITYLLTLTLAAGAWYAYHERERLNDYPWLAEWATRACAHLGCEAPTARQVDRIQVVERNVYSLPGRPDVVTITATLVNQAPYPQPYPVMQVSFTSLQGAMVAQRRFQPDEYLANTPAPGALMPPGMRIRVRAEMPDPGETANAFEFSFL